MKNLFITLFLASLFNNLANAGEMHVFKDDTGQVLLTNVVSNGRPAGNHFQNFTKESKRDKNGNWTTIERKASNPPNIKNETTKNKTDNLKNRKSKEQTVEWNEEKYYESENNPKGINSDDEMDKDIIAYSKEAAKYNLCGDYNSGMGDLGNYSIYYYNAVTTKYDRELIKRYGDRGKVEEAIANKLDNLVEKEKFRLVHEGIPSTMCENLESLDRDY